MAAMDLLHNSALWNIKTKATVRPGIRPQKSRGPLFVWASNGPKEGNGAVDTKFTASEHLLTVKRALSMMEPEQKARQGLSVAYQGVPGAYSEEAAISAHPGCRGVPCGAYEAAVGAVERRGADRAIIPVESTLEGTIHPNYDLLLDRRLHIVGEIHYPVQYCLLALPGVGRGEIRRVVSHPLAVSQCRRTLGSLGLAAVSKETTDDTAGAAQHVARAGVADTAAIASARAAEIYGLRVLARGIQDEPCNFTRFLILARDPLIPTGDRPYKTSIVIAHDGELGVVFRVLSAFSFRDINLTKLESKPRRIRSLRAVEGGSGVLKPFEYVFYIDFEATLADKRVQNALSELKEFATFLRVLGSYPTDGGARE